MKTTLLFLPVALVVLLVGIGCVEVEFTNPPPKKTIVGDTQQYEGRWIVTQLFGKAYINEAARHVTMTSLTDGRRAISLKAANPGLKGFDMPVHIYDVAGHVYLGTPSLRVVLDSTNLFVYAIDVYSVADHIKQGKVEGRLTTTKDGNVEATVTASGEDLLRYLKIDAEFFAKPAAVLTREGAYNQPPDRTR